MDNIEFLFIVPTKDSTENLDRLIISFKSQIYSIWKVVFIDASESISSKNFLKKICNDDIRFQYIKEEGKNKSIYNAMNLGFDVCKPNNWILFLGSDDWLSSPFSLNILEKNIRSNINPNNDCVYFCKTKYFDAFTLQEKRVNKIPNYKFLNKKLFSKFLYFGFSPVHQSACFSYSILSKLMPYNTKYILAADLDLFYRLKYLNDFKIYLINEYLVNLLAGGESSKRIFQRILETFKIYLRYFKSNFIVPFLFRYIQKIASLIYKFN